MGKQPEKNEAKTPAKAKRRMPTDDERIAKLEAELAAARKKAEEKGRVEVTKLQEKRAALVKRINDLDEKVEAIDKQLAALGEVPADEPLPQVG